MMDLHQKIYDFKSYKIFVTDIIDHKTLCRSILRYILPYFQLYLFLIIIIIDQLFNGNCYHLPNMTRIRNDYTYLNFEKLILLNRVVSPLT